MASNDNYWSPDGWVSPDGSFVPSSAVPTKAQIAAAPAWAGGPPRPMNTNVDYQPAFGLGMTADTTGTNPLWGQNQSSAAAAKGGYDAPSYPLSNIPLPPTRPAASALQRYQAATQPSTFGSTAPLPPVRPQEDGPPLPTPDQMAQLQAQQAPAQQAMAWQPSSIGQNGGGDPSSAANFMRQQMMPTQGTLDNNSGSGLMSLFHNIGGKNPSTGNGAGSNFQWVRPDSIVGKLMSMFHGLSA